MIERKSIFEALQAKFGPQIIFGYQPSPTDRLDDFFFVQPDRIVEVMAFLRDDERMRFDYLECITGIDYPKEQVVTPTETAAQQADADTPNESSTPSEASESNAEPDANVNTIGTIHVVYHLRSYATGQSVTVKVSLPRQSARVATVSTLWKCADWHERECYDLLGVQFLGHPDLRRLLLPDDWQGHPLRKDYEQPAQYQGIPTTRLNPLDLLNPAAPTKASTAASNKASSTASTAKATP